MISCALPGATLKQLQAALEASWRPDTAYGAVAQNGNPALGQCYPTSWVVQRFFPDFEIVRGSVDTGSGIEAHFWNLDPSVSPTELVDLSWRQFPPGARVIAYEVLSRDRLGDTAATVTRCERLLARVIAALESRSG